jgi:hypothetical protein
MNGSRSTRTRSAGRERVFKSFNELKVFVKPLLLENGAMWRTFGPKSKTAQADPGSNLHMIWTLRKLDRIIPNNRKMINVIEANQQLLNTAALEAFVEFKVHAGAFEANQYGRVDSYPTFPKSFSEIFMS